METTEGKPIGQHHGLMYYTIGQRQGLGIGGVKHATEEPWYVADKDLSRNVLVVAQGEHPALYASGLSCTQVHWIAGTPPSQETLQCKIRYRQQDQTCHITAIDDKQLQVHFATPQRAITPGQSIVFYDGDVCLGGAIIEQALRNIHP